MMTCDCEIIEEKVVLLPHDFLDDSSFRKKVQISKMGTATIYISEI